MTTPAAGAPLIYRFADLALDIARRLVTRQGEPVELKSLDFDLLRFLVESAPNVVNADVLAEKVWGRHFVSPENVAHRVMLLRQGLADDANRPRYIETIRNKGYRLIPIVERIAEPTATATRRSRLVRGIAALLLGTGFIAVGGHWLIGATERPAPSQRSVAVLPFEDLSSDSDHAFFAAGMQDEIVSQLTKISGLRVFAVQPGVSKPPSISDLARDLEVATVLGGSVYYSQGRVRVTPRLTQAATGVSIWSESYERDLSDIFAIQGEIALDVAHTLSVELSGSERERVERVLIDQQAPDSN